MATGSHIVFAYWLRLPSYDSSFLEIALLKAFNDICFKYLYNILQWPWINLFLDLNQLYSEIRLNHHHFPSRIKLNQRGQCKITFPLTKFAYCIGTVNVSASWQRMCLLSSNCYRQWIKLFLCVSSCCVFLDNKLSKYNLQ